MACDGTMPVGSSRVRLDPLSLPIRFAAADANADQQVREVVLDRRGVRLRRAIRGMRMAVNVPLKAFEGVVIRPAEDGDDAMVVALQHADPALSIPLCETASGSEILAQWALWGRVLGLPLLVLDGDADTAEAREADIVFAGCDRRNRRSAIKARRPSFLQRRKAGSARPMPVHRGEREIIARN